ncbi:MAG: DUF1566 domain-containing protein [Treponema sp.]|nr:DUF1566 domain-containing protein [Treponema sp.]
MKKIKFLAFSVFAALALFLAGCDNGASLEDDSGTNTTQISDSGNTEKESSGDEKTDNSTTDDVESPAATYTVTIAENIENGTVTANKTSGIKAGETITLTITPAITDEDDYELDELSVKNGETAVTINNNAFTMPAGNVTVTATFKKIVYIGSKKPSIAKEVGDIVFNDGSAMPYTKGLTFTNAQKSAAIAIIFYKGTTLNSDIYATDEEGNVTWKTGDSETVRTLGVGVKLHGDLETSVWCRLTKANDTANAYKMNIKTIQCILEENEGTYTYTGDKNGSDNLEQIAAFLNAKGVTDDTATAANYPAFYFAKNYSTKATNLGTIYESGWYLPSIAELLELFKEKAEVNAAIKAVGGNGFNNSSYWSSTQSNTDDTQSISLSFNNGDGSRRSSSKRNDLFMCVIREFN